MSIEQALQQRSGNQCELCGSHDGLAVVAVEPSDGSAEQSIYLCGKCQGQLAGDELDVNHWRCLNDSMWSQEPAVQVMAWRQLSALSAAAETWAQDLLDMLYLDDDTLAWAKAGAATASTAENEAPTLDSNGVVLQAGDTVTLIKDLPVKGAGFTAKRGTAVRGISLTNNPEQIEGRVNGQRIVLLTKFLKKQ